MIPALRRVLLACAMALAGCSGTSTPACSPGPTLALLGYSEAQTPYEAEINPILTGVYSTSATFLVFQPDNGNLVTVRGTAILTGSDGSKLYGAPFDDEGVTPPVSHTSYITAYFAGISGLEADMTYTVSFNSLEGVQGCQYPGQTVGSFVTD